MKRYSHKLHGHWVKLKDSTRYGRIGYYDRKTKLVHIVWDPVKYGWKGYLFKESAYSSTAENPEDLVLVRKWEPEPWYHKIRSPI